MSKKFPELSLSAHPMAAPNPARFRMTPEETERKAQLLALFDKSDKRGQDLLLQIAAIHANRYPRSQS